MDAPCTRLMNSENFAQTLLYCQRSVFWNASAEFTEPRQMSVFIELLSPYSIHSHRCERERESVSEHWDSGGALALALSLINHDVSRDGSESSAGSIPKNLGIGIGWESIQNRFFIVKS